MRTGTQDSPMQPQDAAAIDDISAGDTAAPATSAAALAALREDIDTLRLQILALQGRTRSTAKAGWHWIDASAHAQLGRHAWSKLAAATAAAFFAGRLLRAVPFGTVVTAGLAMATAASGRRRD